MSESIKALKEAVTKGAAWLDTVKPGWAEVINLRRLDMQESCSCVMGHIYGNFAQRPDRVKPDSAAEALGFYVAYSNAGNAARQDRHYEILDMLWEIEVRKRAPFNI